MDGIEKDIVKLMSEQSELDILIERGIEFEAGGNKYTINEPTLRTLDILASEMLKIEIDDTILKQQENTQELIKDGLRLVGLNSARIARIIAVATLGNEARDKAKLEARTAELLDVLKPSKAQQLMQAIQLIMNVGSFISSTRSIGEIRRAMPNLVEQGV